YVIVPVPASEPARDGTGPRLSAPNPAGEPQAASEIIPSPRHRFHFTADAELLALVERLRGPEAAAGCRGPSDAPDNIRLLCRTHNQRLGRRRFGPRRRS
ncbi:MAG: hypothetical protein AAB262_11955, partial [Elusimicrobiota bacterium]